MKNMKKIFTTIIFLILTQPVNAWTIKSLMCNAECKASAASTCSSQWQQYEKSIADSVKKDLYDKCMDAYMSNNDNW